MAKSDELIFISYSEHDKAPAGDVRDALVAAGYGVYFAEERFDGLEELTQELKSALDASSLVVGLVSQRFLDSGPCAWEAIHTFRSDLLSGRDRYRAATLGDFPGRARGLERYHLPSQLRADPRHLVEEVNNFLSRRAPAQGEPRVAASEPRFVWGERGVGQRVFGRAWEMLELLYEVTDHRDLVEGRHRRAPVVQIAGLAGMGKSALADEFIRTFGALAPLGHVRFSAKGDEVGNVVRRDHDRAFVLGHIAEQMKLHLEALAEQFPGVDWGATRRSTDAQPRSLKQTERFLEDLRAEVAAAYGAIAAAHDVTVPHVLWIVDDVPDQFESHLGYLTCPAPQKSLTILTARAPIPALGTDAKVELVGLERMPARRLLLSNVGRIGDDEALRMSPLVDKLAIELLGGYPLGLALAARRLNSGTLEVGLEALIDEATNPQLEGLLDEDTSALLPSHQASGIVAIVGGSIRQAADTSLGRAPGIDAVMALLRVLAITPVEPVLRVDLVVEVLRALQMNPNPTSAMQLLLDSGVATQPDGVHDAKGIAVHAVTRRVIAAMHERDLWPFTSNPKLDSDIALAAARHFVRVGEAQRDGDVVRGRDECERALFSLRNVENRDEEYYRLYANACRGVARSEVRASSRGGSALESEPTMQALDYVFFGLETLGLGEQKFPGVHVLMWERYRTWALLGVLAGRLPQTGDLAAMRKVLARAHDLGTPHSCDPDKVSDDEVEGRVASFASSIAREQGEARWALAEETQKPEDLADAADALMNLPNVHINLAKVAASRNQVIEWRQGLDQAASDSSRALDIRTRVYAQHLSTADAWWNLPTRVDPVAPSEEAISALHRTAACTYGLAVVSYLTASFGQSALLQRKAQLTTAKAMLHGALRYQLLCESEVPISKTVLLVCKTAFAEWEIASGADIDLTVSIANAPVFAVGTDPHFGVPPRGTLDQPTAELIEFLRGEGRAAVGDQRDAAMCLMLLYLGEAQAQSPVDSQVALEAALGWLGSNEPTGWGLKRLSEEWHRDEKYRMAPNQSEGVVSE